jgi:hypothetical protein
MIRGWMRLKEKEQNLEDKIGIFNRNQPICIDHKGQIYPTIYDNNPTNYCQYYAACPYKKSSDMETKNICTYYSTLSLMFDGQLKFDYGN